MFLWKTKKADIELRVQMVKTINLHRGSAVLCFRSIVCSLKFGVATKANTAIKTSDHL